MGISDFNIEDIKIKLASSPEEIEAAQHLRYKVFYEEFGARPTDDMKSKRLDYDDFDTVADHIIAIDTSKTELKGRVIGTYRLLRNDVAQSFGQYYTSDEYNLDPLIKCDETLLELGRSCVLDIYRTKPIMQLLWEAIVDYTQKHTIGLMFGCASLIGTDIDALSRQLSYLYHFHLAPEKWCPVALNERYVDMNILPKDSLDQKTSFKELPPLVKGYLRAGAYIGEGAVIDHQFNTTDVCIVLPVELIASRYKKHYTRKINQANHDKQAGESDTVTGEQVTTPQSA